MSLTCVIVPDFCDGTQSKVSEERMSPSKSKLTSVTATSDSD